MVDFEKIEFKIKESVALDLESIYVTIKKFDDLIKIREWGAERGLFDGVKRSEECPRVFKIFLSQKCVEIYKPIVAALPFRWMVKTITPGAKNAQV